MTPVKGTLEIRVEELPDDEQAAQLSDLCCQYRDLSAAKKSIEEEMDDLKSLIADIGEWAAGETGAEKVVGDGWRLGRRAGRKFLSKTKLLENGVGLDVIQASYDQGKGYWQVDPVKGVGG